MASLGHPLFLVAIWILSWILVVPGTVSEGLNGWSEAFMAGLAGELNGWLRSEALTAGAAANGGGSG